MRRALQLSKVIFVSFFFVSSIFGQVVLQDAMRAFQNGNYNQSAKLFEDYCQDFPYDASAFQYLVNSHLQLKNNDKAISLLEDGVNRFANNDALKLLLAKLYLSKIDLNRAETILVELSKRNYQIAEVNHLLGKTYFNKAVLHAQKKKNSKALENIEKAIDFGVDNYELFALKAQILLNLKKLKSAEKAIDDGLKLYPDEKMLLTTKAILFIEQKKYEEAITIITPLWEEEQNDVQLGLQLAMLYRATHKIEEAFIVYNILLEKYPKKRVIYDAMIDYLKLTGKQEKLRSLYESMKLEFPNDDELDYKIAQTYTEEKNDSLTIVKLNEFIENKGNSEEISLQLAELYLKTNERDSAIEVLKKAIDEKINGEKVFLKLGEIFVEANDFELAKNNFEKYLSIYPKSYLPYLELGKLFKSKKEYKTAKKYFNQGLDVSNSNPILLSELAEIIDMTEPKKNAINIYKETFISVVKSLVEEQKFVKTKIASTSNILELENDKDLKGNKVELLKDITNKSFYYLLESIDETEIQKLFNPILKKFPQSAILLFYQGEIYFKANKYNKAKKFYTRALSTNSKFEEVHLRLAEIYLEHNQSSKAILSYKRVLGINPNSSKAYKELIRLYRANEKLSYLCDEWLNIFATQPDNKLLEEYLIIALHKAGRIEEAKEIINKSE